MYKALSLILIPLTVVVVPVYAHADTPTPTPVVCEYAAPGGGCYPAPSIMDTPTVPAATTTTTVGSYPEGDMPMVTVPLPACEPNGPCTGHPVAAPVTTTTTTVAATTVPVQVADAAVVENHAPVYGPAKAKALTLPATE